MRLGLAVWVMPGGTSWAPGGNLDGPGLRFGELLVSPPAGVMNGRLNGDWKFREGGNSRAAWNF